MNPILVSIITALLTFTTIEMVKLATWETVRAVRGLVNDVSSGLILYADVYSNLGSADEERQGLAKDEFRVLASRLSTQAWRVQGPMLFWARPWVVPSGSDLKRSSSLMIGLSNSVWRNVEMDGGNAARVAEICRRLRIKYDH